MRRARSTKAQKEFEENALAGLRSALADHRGRCFIQMIFIWTRVLENAMKETDRYTAFALGEQNVGLQLLAMLEKADPEAWLKLRGEMTQLTEATKQHPEEGYDG